MAIASLADLRAAARGTTICVKNAVGSTFTLTQTGSEFPFWDMGGIPSAGSYASDLTTGIVPTDATAGAIALPPFSGSAYLSAVEVWDNGSDFGRFALYDRLFTCGPFTTNSNVTLSGQPSYASRVPGGTDFTGLLLMLEQSGASGNTQTATVTVTYTNQSGVNGQSTPAMAAAFSTGNVGRQRFVMPYAQGDCGIQKVESVVVSNASCKNWNVIVLRPLWSGYVQLAGTPTIHSLVQTGLPEIFAGSCLDLALKSAAPSSSSPKVDFSIEIASL